VLHANARLSEYARLLAVRRVEQGHKPGEVAKQLGVSRQTIYKWVRRHLVRAERGDRCSGVVDRASPPGGVPAGR
jgi:transposase